MSPERVVTLVHGTWARDAAWVQDGSNLCKSLAAMEPPPLVRRFQWSGHNSHAARLQAAAELRAQLVKTCAEFPHAEHHLIAHSHGGNVALYALRDPTLCARIASVVCLATPFIWARARPLEPAFLVLRVMFQSLGLAPGSILAILALLFAVGATQALPASPLEQVVRESGVPQPVILAGLASLSGLLLWTGLRAANRLQHKLVGWARPRLERYQHTLVDDFNHRAVGELQVLDVQVEGDEPARWLRALRWASEPRGDSRGVFGIAAGLALMLGGALAVEFLHDPEATGSLFGMAFFATFALLSMLLVWLVMLALGFLISQLIFILMPVVFRAHAGGFGEWSIWANWLALIEARVEPDGGFELQGFRIATRGKGLRHSQIYEDQRVLRHIKQWLERTRLPERSGRQR